MSEIIKYKLYRKGNSALTFHGTKVARANTHTTTGVNMNRWHDVTVFRTIANRYVVSVWYHTQWQGECDSFKTYLLETNTSDVVELLQNYEREELSFGYSADLRAIMQNRWDVMVSEILHQIGAEEYID
jgi:hypothetical protein